MKHAQVGIKLAGVWYRRVLVGGHCHWMERDAYFRERAIINRAQEELFGTPLTLRGNPHYELTDSELRARRRANPKQNDE